MAKSNLIFMGTDALLKATGITDVITGDLLNTATITVSIFDGTARRPSSMLPFNSGGTVIPAIGDEIEGEVGGATAIVNGVFVESGSWQGGDAAGVLEISGQSGAFQAETIKIGTDLDVATIAADSTGIAAKTSDAGAKTLIPMNTVGLTTGGFIRIESTKNYDGQHTIDLINSPADGYLKIDVAYVAEIFSGDEVIYAGIGGGQDIALAHGALADGVYQGTQPDDLERIFENREYFLFEKIVHGASIVLHRYHWPAGYYENVLTA